MNPRSPVEVLDTLLNPPALPSGIPLFQVLNQAVGRGVVVACRTWDRSIDPVGKFTVARFIEVSSVKVPPAAAQAASARSRGTYSRTTKNRPSMLVPCSDIGNSDTSGREASRD